MPRLVHHFSSILPIDIGSGPIANLFQGARASLIPSSLRLIKISATEHCSIMAFKCRDIYDALRKFNFHVLEKCFMGCFGNGAPRERGVWGMGNGILIS